MALKADGTVVAWGRNDYGQAAAPASVYDLNLPVGVSGVVDTPPPGSYQLTYTATNNLGAVGVATRTIVVVDTIPPVLALLGDDPLVQAVGTPFIDPGVIATDACEGDSTESIVVTGNVNSDVLGSYTITYTATDAYGNPGTTNRGVWVCGQPALSNLSSALTATNVIMGTRSATFHAAVTPNGLATGAWFEYGLSTNYAGASPATNLTATFTSSSWSTTLDGLMAGYSYYWRVVATNVLGITVSDWQSLTSSSAGNRAPVANPNTLSTCQGQPASVSAARLLANDADPDGDPLTLTGVTAGSAHGTVGLSGTVVTYTPAEGFTGADSFTYTISDGKGGVATTTVTVTVTSGAGPVQSVAYAAEGVTLRFAGVPAWSYSVQRATDLGGPWTGLHTTNAPPAGVFSYTDATPPSPSGYYRLRRNP